MVTCKKSLSIHHFKHFQKHLPLFEFHLQWNTAVYQTLFLFTQAMSDKLNLKIRTRDIRIVVKKYNKFLKLSELNVQY